MKRGALNGGAILPEIKLYCVFKWLARESYTDILYFCRISKTAFYSVLWATIEAIYTASDLDINFPSNIDECMKAAQGFLSISSGEAIDTCVCVIDGYHLNIQVPSKSEAGNVQSFFSGHYQSYGINVQGACDHNCCFVFLGIAGPGVMADCDAIAECPLGRLIENLPGLFCAIGDCAYLPTEHLVPIFGGA